QDFGARVALEVVVAGGVHVLNDRGGDVGVDVKRGGSGGPVTGALFAVNGAPGKGGARQAEAVRAWLRRGQRRVAQAQAVGRRLGHGVGEHRHDVALTVPERVTVVAGAGEAFGRNGSALGPRAGREDLKQRVANRLLQLGIALQ